MFVFVLFEKNTENGRTAGTITVPPNWLLSEERGASSLSLLLTSRISARARAYAHVHVPPGRDGAALCTAQLEQI